MFRNWDLIDMKYEKSLILIIYFIFSCSHNTENKSPANNKVALRVADVVITEYELEKNLKKFKDTYYDTAKVQAGEYEIKNWIQDFIDRAYFLADAYEKGHNKRSEVARGVESMEKLMISQPKGILEQFLIDKKLYIDEKEIKAAQERSRKKIKIEYLKFENLDSAVHFLGENKLNSKKKFNEAVGNSINHKNIIHNEETITWPFMIFWEHGEYLFTLRKGEITPILKFQHGYYIFYLKDIELSNEHTPNDEIIQKLKLQKEKKIITEYRDEFNSSVNITFNLDVLYRFEEILSEIVPLHEFKKQDFNEILSANAFTFYLKEKRMKYSISDLIDYYNYLPIKQEIRTSEQIAHLIRSLVYNEYSYLKAEELGLTNNPEFILDRENYRKNLIYSYYEMEALKKSIKISAHEISNWYAKNKTRYIKPVGVNISILSFDNRQNAGKGIMYIKQNLNDSSHLITLKGLEEIKLNVNIAYDETIFPPKITQRLLLMENDQILPTAELDDKYLVIIKNYDYGQRTMQLHEAKEVVIREIEASKLNEIKKRQLRLLKAKYPCANDIEHEKYL